MPTVPLHPAMVHVPLGLAVIAPIVMTGLALALWRGLIPRRSWVVAVVLQGLLVAGGAVALRTGERDEKRVEQVVGKAAVEAHEQAAEVFVMAAAAVLAVTVLVLGLPGRAAAAAAATATVGALAVAALAYAVGSAGGELVYVRGAARAYVDPGGPVAPPVATRHHDRDHDDD